VSEALATKLLIPSKDGPSGILSLIDEYIGLQGTEDKDDAPAWAAETLAPALGQPRIPIYPRVLGDRLRGGLWPGHHMTVFARPEIGKSAFAINVAVMAASRGKARVLYLSNEDPVRDLMLRALVRFNGVPHDEVLKDLHAAVHQARGYGADRIVFRDMAPGSLAEVDRLVRRYKPDLLIVDQMRNMGTGKTGENMTQRLDSVAQGLRNIGKRNACAVLSVTQAGDSARDKAILDDGDVDNSNTGVSAGCDVLIGIGATAIMREAGERRLCIIKNKLGGSHGYADVRLDPLTLAFRDR
jgi:KaiC/GvpD/RAD55 family RecA-like ATPase